MRITHLVLVMIVALGLPACGNDNPPPPPPPPPGVVPPVIPGQPVVPGQPGQPGQPGVVAPGGPSNFGTITLAPGFTPDPSLSRGRSGGTVNASGWNSTCRGWVSQTPDHLFVAAGNFPNLRVLVNGGAADVTLVVQKPDGSYLCNDDAEGRNPIVQGPFVPGTYKLWVGSYNEGVNADYNLGLSEIPSVTVAQLGAPAMAGTPPNPGDLTSNFGTVTLTPGFTPDPSVSRGTAGGTMQASNWNAGCGGWVSQTPDHIFSASGNFGFMKILVSSQNDTTLVVQKPDGSYLCNDDGEGLNPVITGAFPPGNYRVWVGSYAQGENPQYTIGFSELSGTNTSRL